MFGFVHCNASALARQTTDPNLFFVRTLVKNWLWPIITFFGVTGNILAVIVLTKRRMIMSSTNNYLAALAIVDIAYLVLTLILNTAQHPCFTGLTSSDILSTICRPIADFSSNTSVWLTVTFTVERWVAISYPLQSRTWCTVHRARKIIISVMCAALICTSPSAFEMKLVRVMEIINSTNSNEQPKIINRIRAKPTALGNSLLYHQIYFNFVTFAIIWIPLLLLVIFNTILIIYVHRSKQSDRKSSEGVQLRRHNRGSQGEQRKTTIMLIAVVIVFTVCQIPQAISLTVQSFFPVLSQTPKVLIYNNFANCLVALNASMNFLLYCCFSDRFRSTFSSSFAFLTKYCVHYIEPNCKLTADNNNYSVSVDNMSFNSPHNQSNYSLKTQALNARTSHISNDGNRRSLRQTMSNSSQKQTPFSNQSNNKSWISIFRRFKSNKKQKINYKQTLVWQNSDTALSSPTTSIIKRPSSIRCQPRVSNNLTPGDAILKSLSFEEQIPLRLSTVSFQTDTPHSSSMQTFNQPVNRNDSKGKLKKASSVGTNRLPKPSLISHPTYSQRSLNDDNNNNTEQIWIKRRLSNSAVEKLFDRRKPFLWKEIVDVTV